MGNQIAHQRHPDDESQGPADLGQPEDEAAPLVWNEVAQVGLHRGDEHVVAHQGKHQGEQERPVNGPDDYQQAANRINQQSEEHASPAAAAIGNGRQERREDPRRSAQGDSNRERRQIHSQTAGEDGQEGVHHPYGGIEHRPDGNERADLRRQAFQPWLLASGTNFEDVKDARYLPGCQHGEGEKQGKEELDAPRTRTTKWEMAGA